MLPKGKTHCLATSPFLLFLPVTSGCCGALLLIPTSWILFLCTRAHRNWCWGIAASSGPWLTPVREPQVASLGRRQRAELGRGPALLSPLAH